MGVVMEFEQFETDLYYPAQQKYLRVKVLYSDDDVSLVVRMDGRKKGKHRLLNSRLNHKIRMIEE